MLYVLGEETFDNGYQPKTINGKTLKKTGLTVGKTGLKGSTSWNGKNMDDQNIWSDGERQWIWVRTGEGQGHYVSYDMMHKGAVDFSDTKSVSYQNYAKNSRNFAASSPNTAAVEASKPAANTNTQNQTTTTKPNTNTNSGSGGSGYTSDPGLYDLINDIRNENKELQAKIEELSKPKYYTADELAEMHGVQDLYNEQKWLDDYNAATNQYYDEAVKTQQGLRNDYAINNGQYLDKTIESYMNSYANQAPTATAKGATAANALSTLIGAGQTYSNDDYNMLQTQNLLEEQRKAELANNPNLARQQYNSIGTMLSTLGTDYYSSAVKEYVNQLDAYGAMYSNNRAAESLANSGTAAKYNGLLTAAQTNAANKANTSSWDYLLNYYKTTRNDNSYAADSAIANLLKSSMNTAK